MRQHLIAPSSECKHELSEPRRHMAAPRDPPSSLFNGSGAEDSAAKPALGAGRKFCLANSW